MKNKIKTLTRTVKHIINNLVIEYNEKYCIDQDGKEVYDKNLVLENDIKYTNTYKIKKGLLTLNDLKQIRNSLGLSPKKYFYTLFQDEVKLHIINEVSNELPSM